MSLLLKRLSSSSASYPLHTPHITSLLTKQIPTNQTHYEVLGLSTTASTAEIKKTFKTLSKHLHPDLNLKKSEILKKVIKANYLKVIASYKVLSNDAKKLQYDRSLNIRPSFTHFTSPSTSTKIHYGSGFTRSRPHSSSKYANFDKTSYATGLNDDVPHFDYDKHLSGNLWFERRMIAKKLAQQGIKQEETFEQYSGDNSNLEESVRETLNLQRSARYQQQLHEKMMREHGRVDLSGFYRGHNETAAKGGKAMLLTIAGLGLLTVGSFFL